MSSRSEGDCDPVFGSQESCGRGDSSATAEANDIEGCIEKLSKFGTVRVAIFEEGKAREWLKSIQALSKVTWRVSKTVPGGKLNVFKIVYRCQHNVRGTLALKTKNTNCPAKLRLILRRTQLAKGAKSRSKDVLIATHPLIASLDGEHNHPIETAAALKYRDVSEEVQQHLKDLFAAGHSASSAYNLIRCQLMARDPENYVVHAADRHNLPDLQYCYNLYYKVRREEYSVPAGDVLLAAAQERAATSNDIMACRITSESAFIVCQESHRQPSDAAEALSCSPGDDVSWQRQESHMQRASDETQQVAEVALPNPFAGVEQESQEGATKENADENLETVRLAYAFIDDLAATPEGLKALTAMMKTVKRLGQGPALHRAVRTFGHVTAPSLHATKTTSTTTIGMQPSAVACRNMVLGGGRKRVSADRPASTAHFAGQLLHAAKRRRTPAPHSLSHCGN